MLELERAWSELYNFIKGNKEQIKKEVKKAFNDDPRIFVSVPNLSNLDIHVKYGSNHTPSILHIDFIDGSQKSKGKIRKKENVLEFLTYNGNQYINRTIIRYYSIFDLKNRSTRSFSAVDSNYITYNGIRIDVTQLQQSLCFSYRTYYNDENISVQEVEQREASYHHYICKTMAEKLPKGYYVAKLLMLAKRFDFLLQTFKKVVSQAPLDFLNRVPVRYLLQDSMFTYSVHSYIQQAFKTISAKRYGHSLFSGQYQFIMEEECANNVDKNHIHLYLTDPDKRIFYDIHLAIPEEEAEQRVFLNVIDTLCKDINYD